MIAGARLQTETGAITISTAWSLTRLRVVSTTAPGTMRVPRLSGMDFVSGRSKKGWAFANSRCDMEVGLGDPVGAGWARPWEESFSNLEVVAARPERLELIDLPLPSDSWVRTHGEALPLLQALSDASGGRLFEVSSIEDLAPVYARVAQDLRNVYTIGYYPTNQDSTAVAHHPPAGEASGADRADVAGLSAM